MIKNGPLLGIFFLSADLCMEEKPNDDFFTEICLKSTLKHSPLEKILRYQYKYRHPTNNRYILVYSVIDYSNINDPNDKGVSKAYWSKYDDDDETFQEERVDMSDDFHKILLSGGWEKDGKGEFVVVK
jgi:hypothetical protein